LVPSGLWERVIKVALKTTNRPWSGIEIQVLISIPFKKS